MQASVEITFLPANKRIEISPRSSLRDAGLIAGLGLTGTCGGNGVCGKCRVKLVSGQVEGEAGEDGYRLACRSFPRTDCLVEVPESSIRVAPKVLVRGAGKDFPIDPPAFLDLPDNDPLREEALGVACDIGTTTVVCALARLKAGEVIGTASRGNPQARYGDDVLSRIAYSSKPGGLDELKSLVVGTLDELISETCNTAGVNRRDILDVTVAGNATMTHLLVGKSPSSLGVAPYEPEFLEHDPIPLENLSLESRPDASMRLLPNIAGFIGGDTVAGILSIGLNRSSTLKLFIDIGTNGEIAVGSGEGLVTCSAAAGPAFEGGRIAQGMHAEPGAIERVKFHGGVRIGTIDNVRPRGICGTGVIQAVGCMLEAGIIDRSGQILSPDEVKASFQNVSRNIIEDKTGRRFVLWTDGEDEISITQKDISEIAIAKAAIRAGAEILLRETGASWDDVNEVLFAGAFGSFLRTGDAERIGLIPGIKGKVRFVGNSSLEGALRVLLSVTETGEASRIARSSRSIELAGRQDFQDEFVDAIPFP